MNKTYYVGYFLDFLLFSIGFLVSLPTFLLVRLMEYITAGAFVPVPCEM